MVWLFPNNYTGFHQIEPDNEETMTTTGFVRAQIDVLNAVSKSEAAPQQRLNKGNYRGMELTATRGVKAQALVPKAIKQENEQKVSREMPTVSKEAPTVSKEEPIVSKEASTVAVKKNSVSSLAGMFGTMRKVSSPSRGAAPAGTSARPTPAPRLSLQKSVPLPVPAPRTVSLEDFYQIQSIRADEAAGRTPQNRKILSGDIDPSIYRNPETQGKPLMSEHDAVKSLVAAFGNPGNSDLVKKAAKTVSAYKNKKDGRAAKKAAAELAPAALVDVARLFSESNSASKAKPKQ